MGVRVVALVVTLSLSTSLSTAAAEPVSATEAKVLGADQAGAVPNSYIVRIKDSASPKSRSSLTAKDLTAKYGGTVKVAWQNALNGFAVSMNPEQARRLAADRRVALVEQDAQVHAVDVQPNPPSWGLDRVDQRDLPLNNTYTFDATAGNVHAYVIDTGIRVTHSAFGGRATWGHNSIDTDDTDCNGHGTHVAGTIGGNQYGVAQGVQLVAVKVLDCTANGTFEQVIDGVNWVAQNAVKPAVANMSLGGQASSPAMEDAVRAAIASGVTFTIASGNGNTDACTYTPAKVTEAITVNASTPTDARAAFSNFGPCTDLYAPGTDIVSAWNTDDNATHVDGGTSMAAPHVTGAAALWLASHPNDSPAAVQAALIAQATPDKVTDPGAGSPNKLLFTNPTLAPVIVVPGPQVGTIGVQFNLQLSAFGGAGPYTWDAANLPDGLSVNDAGLLSGSPTTRGLSTVTITATDSAGKSGTATFTLMVKAACQAGQLIANPGFESGADSWITTPGVIVPGTAAQPTHSGTMFAWLDGYGAIHTDTVTQTVTLPFDCGTYTLSYWLHIDSTEPTTTTVFDSMNVLVGTKTLASYTNLDKADGYQLRTFDLSQFAGQTVTLTFTGTEDASLQTSFVVDDVGLTVG